MTNRRNRFVLGVMLASIAVTSLVIVVLSPFALRAIAFWPGMDWAKLSNIGQTYGAVSALIAALALAGVAISILIQARQVRHNRWEARRTRHFELMRIAMEDPFYRQVFYLSDMLEDDSRLAGYIHMILEFWAMLWEFDDLTE